MKAKTFKLVSLIVALLAAVILTVGYVFAWFFDTKNAEFTINGKSAGAYFDSGDGSEEKPFVIANPTHMHNLAVLQNTGKFTVNGVQKQYYFEIKKTIDEIDMTEMYMPPIGNDEFPFIGIFNGNGKTVSNLTVTTNKSLLGDNYPTESSADYSFSRAVGLFGMTGDVSDISNVILENPLVDVANENTKYLSADAGAIKAAKQVAGIAVGFVAGKCSSIGVRAVGEGATLHLKVNGYSTFNSILGALDDNVTSAVTGGGHGVGGSGAAFGATFDIASMLDRLYKIYKGKYGVDYKKGNKNEPTADSSVMLPTVDTQNAVPVPGEGAQLAFTAEPEPASTYGGPKASEKISDQNVGYFLGNQNKFDTKQFTFIDRMVNPNNDWLDWRDSNSVTSTNVPAWFYTFDEVISDNAGNGCRSAQSFREMTDAEFEDLPFNVKNLLPAVGSQKTFTTIRISQGGVSTMNYGNTEKTQWSYHGQISWMGKTYGKGFRGLTGLPVDENGNVLTDGNDQWGNQSTYNAYTKGVALPNSSIWFKPAQAGKFRFIMYSQSDGDGFTLDKIVRTNANKDNPFYVDTDFNVHGDDVEAETIIQQRLPTGILFYYEYDVKEEEIEAGNVEFMLQKNGSNGAHFIYLDIGASATDDTSTINREKAVSAVDFIYDGVEIKQGNPADDAADAAIKVGDFIVKTSGEEALYESSKTSVYFENLSTVFKLVFLRLYSGSDTHTDKTKTICLEQSNPVPDKDSDIKATFATYVCPTIGGGSGTVSSGGGGGGTVTPTPGPDDEVTETSVNFKTIYDATDGTADSNGRKDIAAGTTYGNITFNGGKISEDSYNNQTNTFAVKLNSSTNSIKLVGTGASGSGATVSIVITDADGNEVGRSSQEAASNEEVSLTISNLAAGTYTVSVVKTNQSGSGSVKFTEISVTDGTSGTVTPGPENVAVTSVSISGAPATLTVGGTANLTATVSPTNATDKTVTWTSSNSNIAEVDSNGNVTAKAAGTVTITATAGGKSDSVEITVTAGSSTTYESWSIDFAATAPDKNVSLSDGDVLIENALTVKTSSNSNINTGGYLKGNTDGVLELKVEADAEFTYVCANKNSARTLVIKDADGEIVHSQAMDNESHTVSLSAGTYTITFLGGECRISSFALTY